MRGRAGALRVVGVGELDALADAWDELAPLSHLPSPMQGHAWVRRAAEAFAGFLVSRIAVLGDPPRAIAPLAARRTGPPRLELLGARELYEPADLLYRDEDALQELLYALVRLGPPLLLSRLPLESPTYRALRRPLGVRTRVRTRGEDAMPVIDLAGLRGDADGVLTARRRSDLRRAERRARSRGDLAFELLAPGAEDVDALLAEALDVEARGWKGAAGTALVSDALRLPFYRRYAHDAAAAGTLRIAFLRIGGHAAAMQVLVELNGSLWLLKIGYDGEYARCSPGQLLMLETVRYAVGRGLSTVEFIGSAAPWTRTWAPRERPCAFVDVYPLRAASLPAAAYDEARRAARALIRA